MTDAEGRHVLPTTVERAVWMLRRRQRRSCGRRRRRRGGVFGKKFTSPLDTKPQNRQNRHRQIFSPKNTIVVIPTLLYGLSRDWATEVFETLQLWAITARA